MSDNRHNSDKVVYLVGDRDDPTLFRYAANTIRATTDYTVVDTANHNPCRYLIRRLIWLDEVADVVVLLPGYLSCPDAGVEAAYARAVGIEVVSYEDFLGPYERLVDCD